MIELQKANDPSPSVDDYYRMGLLESLAWEHSVKNLLAAYERAFNKRAKSVAPVLQDS